MGKCLVPRFLKVYLKFKVGLLRYTFSFFLVLGFNPQISYYNILFLESGFWDSLLIRVFERSLGLFFLWTLAPLSSLSLGENGGKVALTLISKVLNFDSFNQISITSLLVTLSKGLVFILALSFLLFIFI